MKRMRTTIAIASSVILIAGIAVGFIVFYPSATAPGPQKRIGHVQISGTPIYSNRITIQDYTFTPRIVSVKKGTTVIWTNNDTVPQSVVFDTHSFGDSGALNNEASFGLAFDTVGEYTYHSGMYPDAVGKIIVTD